jgi:hypothetical protein
MVTYKGCQKRGGQIKFGNGPHKEEGEEDDHERPGLITSRRPWQPGTLMSKISRTILGGEEVARNVRKGRRTLEEKKIIVHFRYDIYIQIIRNSKQRDIIKTIRAFNSQGPSLKLTMELENIKKLSFLNIMISTESKNLTFSIYTKPTTTDILIHKRLCHFNEHNLVSTYYIIQRLNPFWTRG